MILGICLLLTFQLVGEITSYIIGGAVPGPVVGMALIAAYLYATRNIPGLSDKNEQGMVVSKAILGNLGILFVPAGVGIVQHIDLIKEHGIAIFAIVLASTVLTLTVTVWTFIGAKRLLGGRVDG